jgi:hypothetical protein
LFCNYCYLKTKKCNNFIWIRWKKSEKQQNYYIKNKIIFISSLYWQCTLVVRILVILPVQLSLLELNSTKMQHACATRLCQSEFALLPCSYAVQPCLDPYNCSAPRRFLSKTAPLSSAVWGCRWHFTRKKNWCGHLTICVDKIGRQFFLGYRVLQSFQIGLPCI